MAGGFSTSVDGGSYAELLISPLSYAQVSDLPDSAGLRGDDQVAGSNGWVILTGGRMPDLDTQLFLQYQ